MYSEDLDNKGVEMEECSSCGKELGDGAARFRKDEFVVCLDCHRDGKVIESGITNIWKELR